MATASEHENEEYFEEEVLVLDVGSDIVKCGFAGHDAPHCTFPCILGLERFCSVLDQRTFVGHEALAQGRKVALKRPMENGQVTNWNDIERVWHHSFYHLLRRAPEEHRVVYVDNPLTQSVNREKIAELMFETFLLPLLHIGLSNVFALYASGKLDGISIDFGSQSTRCLPVYQDHAVQHAFTETPIGGRDVTDRLMKLLEPKDPFSGSGGTVIANDIKEKLAFVSIGKDNEEEIAYEMPDGKTLSVGKERYECTEDFFRAESGVHDIVKQSVMKCDESLRDLLCANLVPSGGCAMFDNMEQRLQNELDAVLKQQLNRSVKVVRNSEKGKRYLSWIGASVFASLPDFTEFCISKRSYDEYGPKVIHHRCF